MISHDVVVAVVDAGSVFLPLCPVLLNSFAPKGGSIKSITVSSHAVQYTV